MALKLIKKKLKNIVAQIEEEIAEPIHKNTYTFISTGSTMMNLACSDRHDYGFAIGTLVNIIGDSSSGKTFLALTCLAEASNNEALNNHKIIYDDVEAANKFDVEYLFGEKTKLRINDGKETKRSKTIEDFQDKIIGLLDEKIPFIYVLDSFDALTSEEGIALARENKKLREKGQKPKGSYGDGKPKAFSEFCKHFVDEIYDNNSLVIIISQTRQNIGFGAMFKPRTRSGGEALKFYSSHEVWLSVKEAEKDKELKVGNLVQAKFTKNKLIGKHRSVIFPVFYDYGIDDISSCIYYLWKIGHWKGTKGKLVVPELDFTGSIKNLILHIEENNLEKKLKLVAQKIWNVKEEEVKMSDRKRKY